MGLRSWWRGQDKPQTSHRDEELIRASATPDPGDEGFLPSDRKYTCLRCQSEGPFAEIILLRSPVLRRDHLVMVVTGARVACQRCSHVFSVSIQGSFEHHMDALPLTGRPLPQAPVKAPVPEPDEPLTPLRKPR
jgi:hypothetical protein